MITGGVKFFGDNPALSANGGIIASVTSGAIVASNMIDKRSDTKWLSVGSSDLTTEVLVLTFSSATFNRLLLLDHNFKSFNVKYWDGVSSFVHFSNVVGMDGSKSNITETAFADDSAYYEFDSVTTTKLQISVTTTQVANAEKYLTTVFPTLELGTMLGFPRVNFTLSPKTREQEMVSGRVNVIKQRQVETAVMALKNYPIRSYGADVDLLISLIERETPFYLWACGGRRGTNYFSYAVPGWRLKDCYRVQLVSDYAEAWTEGIYSSGQSLGDLVFRGHI